MSIAPTILIMLAIYPSANPAEDGKAHPSHCKPGPKVAQELMRLEHESRSVYKRFRDGRVSQLNVIREMARLKTTIETLRNWSCSNQSDEVPWLVVIVDADEYPEVFPRGMRHLPSHLIPGETYPATPRGSRQWQFLGERRVSGMRVVVFRAAVADGAVASEPQN